MHLLRNNRLTGYVDTVRGVYGPPNLKQLCYIKIASHLKERCDVFVLGMYLPRSVRNELSRCWHQYFILNTVSNYTLEVLPFRRVNLSKPLSRREYVHIVHTNRLDFSDLEPPYYIIRRFYFVRNTISRRVPSRRYCKACYRFLVSVHPLPDGCVWEIEKGKNESWNDPNVHLNRLLRRDRMWCTNCILQCLFYVSQI
jgi:hypothetical protein